MSNSRALRLAEVASIETGLALRGAAPLDPDGANRILLAGALPTTSMFRAEDLPACDIPKPTDRVILAAGDVVFLGRSEPRSAVYLGSADTVVLAAPLIRIRLETSDIHPGFLGLHLTSPTVLADLRRAMRGSLAKFIAKADLEQILVPVPPLEVQNRIVAHHRLAEREAELNTRLADLRRHTTNALLAACSDAPQRASAN